MRILWLALALTLLAAWPAAAKTPLPDYPPATPYFRVRAELLGQGYQPVHAPTQNPEDCAEHKFECARYPELWHCNYSIAMPCGYIWRARNGHLLIVVASYGEKEQDVWLDDKMRWATSAERSSMFKPRKSTFPTFKRHTPYGTVRSALLKLGYRPLRLAEPMSPDCSPYGDRCTVFPELESCSGTGAGYCRFGWRAPNGRWIIVETVSMADPIGFYWIDFATPGDIREMKHQMIERQTYVPLD
ncbi:MAG: hypothetical protein JWP73_1861 [Phenylobacterium sp.]|nr:hypothetical protein [Phenylobacterium sp.]